MDGEIGVKTNKEILKTFLLAMTVSTIVVIVIYVSAHYPVRAATQKGIRISLALTPAEAQTRFCQEGQSLVIVVAEERLGRAVCATVVPEPEEKN